jgi:L-cysteine:1D-myo-inositol 2-amino-2-deoxy-alpha-D-glucopyranoside ligase
MVAKYLGETIDLHSGGGDLLFPHHECEIAQIEPITGKRPFVRIWLHTAMVELDGEKMSKSLGNLVMVDDLLKENSADAIRYYLTNHHYRQAWEHDAAALVAATEAVAELRRAAELHSGSQGEALVATTAIDAFAQAMEDDLDTVMALETLRQFALQIQEAARAGRPIANAQAELVKMATVFGLRLTADQPEARVIAGWGEHLMRFS